MSRHDNTSETSPQYSVKTWKSAVCVFMKRLNFGDDNLCEKCRRCASSLTVRHRVSFLNAGKLKSFHTSDSKVAGASAVSPTLLACTDLVVEPKWRTLRVTECKGWWVRMGPTPLRSASPQLNKPGIFLLRGTHRLKIIRLRRREMETAPGSPFAPLCQ